MSGDDSNLSNFSMLDLFRMELDNQLSVLNDGLLELEKTGATVELFEPMMRAAHSIKGAARMVDVNSVVRISHVMEDCFVLAQRGILKLSHDEVDALLAGVDMLAEIGKADDKAILVWENTHESELTRLETALVEMARHSESDNVVRTHHEIDAKLLRSEEEKQAIEKTTHASSEESTLRIDVNRINRILGIAGESLVESHRLTGIMETFVHFKKHQHMLVDQLDQLRAMMQDANVTNAIKEQFSKLYGCALQVRQELNEKVHDLDAFDRRNALLIERLHEEVRSTRMRPISALVQPFPRLVRDLGRQLSKEVRLNMSGLAILVDRDVLERIDSPLKHLIQNAIDHGIEDADSRRNKGKSPEGNISLSVSQSAGMLFIVIEDDGAGVNMGALKKKIVKKGYLDKSEVDKMDVASLLEYLFMPGFSTKSKANTISGRGVGLDLVREAIENLGGSIFATSQPDEGTRFQLLLPQTVSIMRVLLTHVDGELYSFPLSRIHRVIRLENSDIARNELGYCCYREDGTYQLVTVNQLLGYSVVSMGRLFDVVLIKEGDINVGIVVEAILGQREVSIQRIDPELGDIPCINSASILDSGELSMIFDTKEMINQFKLKQKNNEIELPQLHSDSERRVMVVADSVSVRDQSKRFLERNGFSVVTERPSKHTIYRMKGQRPVAFVLSSDMGYSHMMELIDQIQSQDELKDTPIVLVVHQREWRVHGADLNMLGMPLIDSSDIQRQVFLNILNQATEEQSS